MKIPYGQQDNIIATGLFESCNHEVHKGNPPDPVMFDTAGNRNCLALDNLLSTDRM
jgi:hypothetical protein